LSRSLKETYNLEDLERDGRIILKMDLQTYDGAWIHLAQDRNQ
jgi:hypothetical protein